MCKYCDPESKDCCVFKDSQTGDWYLDVETSEWDGYCDDFVHQQVHYISYCPYCGRKLEES